MAFGKVQIKYELLKRWRRILIMLPPALRMIGGSK